MTGVIRWDRFTTPFGPMHVAAGDAGLVSLAWEAGDDGFAGGLEARFAGETVVRDEGGLAPARRQLLAYFDGTRTSFDLPVDLGGRSDFERRVLEATRSIGFGEVLSYGEVARRMGRPRAARPVGGALGRNPVPIVIPCHRVVRSDGSLGGYGRGPAWKERLLALEGSLATTG